MITRKKVYTGEVVSDKMDKTVVVLITTRQLHPLYKKYVTRTKKVKVHDEHNSAQMGDRVRVVECRPISRHKSWRLSGIIERAK